MILVWGLIIVLAIVIIYLIIPGGPAWKKYLADVASSFQQENDIFFAAIGHYRRSYR